MAHMYTISYAALWHNNPAEARSRKNSIGCQNTKNCAYFDIYTCLFVCFHASWRDAWPLFPAGHTLPAEFGLLYLYTLLQLWTPLLPLWIFSADYFPCVSGRKFADTLHLRHLLVASENKATTDASDHESANGLLLLLLKHLQKTETYEQSDAAFYASVDLAFIPEATYST
jgi:hypothetical protein